MRIDDIEIHAGEPAFVYKPLRKLEAKVEATTVFQSAPTVEEANGRLRAMAAKVGANAVINVQYNSGVSMTSWRSMKVTGLAVLRESDEYPCPQCAEMIKRAAKVCRYCNSDASGVSASESITTASSSDAISTQPALAPNIVNQEPLRETNNPQIWIWAIAGVVLLLAILGASGN